MKTLAALAVALSTTALVTSVSAQGLNMPPPGASAQRAAPGDLGMAIMSAVVNPDGATVRGEGVISSAKIGTGYEVVFGRDVTACTSVVGTGLPGSSGTPPAGFAGVVGRSSNARGIFVQTYHKNGDVAAGAFHVVVYCGR